MRAIVIMLLALTFAVLHPAQADQTDPRLEGLFGALKTAGDLRAAMGAEQQIWRIWLESDDRAIELLMEQGIVAMGHKAYSNAIRSFDQVVAIAPDYAEGWNKRATVHYLMGSYEASLRDIARTLALEPRHFGALSGRGLVYMELDEDALALESFEAALEVHPRMPGPRHNAEFLKRRLKDRQI